MAIEEPKYEVSSKNEHYELRKYSSVIVAETQIDSEFGEAGNQGFRILADYIFGNNRSKTKLSMTAPVSQSASTETNQKIAMTAPVNQLKQQNGFLVQFTMPSGFTLQNIPEPNDSRVNIREIPPRTMAVYTYSGSWSESRFQEKLADFRAHLAKNGIKTEGEPVFARFNSPFTLWFLRRNEIWLKVI